jgi:hypothetical protein
MSPPAATEALLRHQKRVEDVVLSSDRTFFEQHPRRQFRVRPAWDVEIEDFARAGAILRTLPDGLCWWFVVHQIQPGYRMRFPLPARPRCGKPTPAVCGTGAVHRRGNSG